MVRYLIETWIESAERLGKIKQHQLVNKWWVVFERTSRKYTITSRSLLYFNFGFMLRSGWEIFVIYIFYLTENVY